MNKWYSTAALSGSGFEHLAENVVTMEDLTNESIKNIDLLFLKDLSVFNRKFRLYQYIALSETPIPPEEQENFILLNPGTNFLSRIGHDIINLFTPFEQFEYLEEEIIRDRVQLGLKFGKQINIAGHILHKTKFCDPENMMMEDFIYLARTMADKKGLKINIDDSNVSKETLLRNESLMNIVIEEIIENGKMHSDGILDLNVSENGTILFSNKFKGQISPDRAKARLRWPFMKSLNSKGNGMGLYILSLASVKGGFSWNIEIKENTFYLSLSF